MKAVSLAWSKMMKTIIPPADYLLQPEEKRDQNEQILLVKLLILYLRVNQLDVRTLFSVIQIYQKPFSTDLHLLIDSIDSATDPTHQDHANGNSNLARRTSLPMLLLN